MILAKSIALVPRRFIKYYRQPIGAPPISAKARNVVIDNTAKK